MSETAVQKFLVFYCIPEATMADWQKVDPVQREATEKAMRNEWERWSAAHADMLLSTEVGGKTKNVAAGKVTDTRNDIVLFSMVQGSSHEAVTELFRNHPHLQIPNATIQVMAVRPM